MIMGSVNVRDGKGYAAAADDDDGGDDDDGDGDDYLHLEHLRLVSTTLRQ
jgi:hypothetical protein